MRDHVNSPPDPSTCTFNFDSWNGLFTIWESHVYHFGLNLTGFKQLTIVYVTPATQPEKDSTTAVVQQLYCVRGVNTPGGTLFIQFINVQVDKTGDSNG